MRYLLFILVSLTANAQLFPFDPRGISLQMPTNYAWPHGFHIVTGASGSNYLAVTSRNGLASAWRFKLDDFSYVATNYTASDPNCYGIPEFCVISNMIFFPMAGTNDPNVSSTIYPYTNWSLVRINPDTWVTETVLKPGQTGVQFCENGSCDTDGTNIYVVSGGPFAIAAKFGTNGTQIWTNYIGVSPQDTNHTWQGKDPHEVRWDQWNYTLWVSDNFPTLYKNNNAVSLKQISPVDGSCTYWAVAFSNTIPTTSKWTPATGVKITDDLAVTPEWVFLGDESGAHGCILGWNKATHQSIGINTGLANIVDQANYGLWYVPPYVWGAWSGGYLSRFKVDAGLTNGLVQVDTFTIGGNTEVLRPADPVNHKFNEFATTNGEVFVSTWWSTSTVYRASILNPNATVWSTTNGVLGAQLSAPLKVQ